MNLSSATTAAALALVVAFAPSASSSSWSAAAAVAGRPPVICVAFHSDEATASLQMDECLTAGNAICSSNGSWAFGIDPADQRIKLWQGNRVSFIYMYGRFFIVLFVLRHI